MVIANVRGTNSGPHWRFPRKSLMYGLMKSGSDMSLFGSIQVSASIQAIATKHPGPGLSSHPCTGRTVCVCLDRPQGPAGAILGHKPPGRTGGLGHIGQTHGKYGSIAIRVDRCAGGVSGCEEENPGWRIWEDGKQRGRHDTGGLRGLAEMGTGTSFRGLQTAQTGLEGLNRPRLSGMEPLKRQRLASTTTTTPLSDCN